jgi:hypothetical protein
LCGRARGIDVDASQMALAHRRAETALG